MSSYSQIYLNKKKNEIKKRKNINQTYNDINKDFSNEFNISNQDNGSKLSFYSEKLNERNPSLLTFSNGNFINNQEIFLKNKEKNILFEESNKNNSFVNGMIIDKNQNHINNENQNRIKYRKKIINKNNYFNSLNNKFIFNSDENQINLKIIPKMDTENMVENKIENIPKNKNILIKEKLNGQLKNNKDYYNETIKSDKIIEDEGNNNFMYDIKDINDYNKKNSEKNENLYDNSIKNEILDDFMIENNLNNNINKLSIIPKEEDTFESINIIKESNNYNILTREQILYFTHIIFLNNASFMKNKECYMMSKSNFLNILKSIKIIKSQLILVQIDLIYDSISSKSSMIDYSQFNQILMKIIKNIYKEQYSKSPQLTINIFITKLINYFNLFFENKIPKDYLYKYQYNSIVKILQIFPNENQIILIKEIILTINEIYEKYFFYELDYNKEYLYKSSENLVLFCKDFEIVPQIINSTQAVTYYNLIIHIQQIYNTLEDSLKKLKICKNKGKIFTLYHFILFIIHMSLYSYTKLFGSKTWNIKNNNISKESKLLLFLEKLEHSKGMTNFLSKLFTPRTKPLSLIPPKRVCLDLGIFELEKKNLKINEFLDEIFQEKKELERSQKKEILKEN